MFPCGFLFSFLFLFSFFLSFFPSLSFLISSGLPQWKFLLSPASMPSASPPMQASLLPGEGPKGRRCSSVYLPPSLQAPRPLGMMPSNYITRHLYLPPSSKHLLSLFISNLSTCAPTTAITTLGDFSLAEQRLIQPPAAGFHDVLTSSALYNLLHLTHMLLLVSLILSPPTHFPLIRSEFQHSLLSVSLRTLSLDSYLYNDTRIHPVHKHKMCTCPFCYGLSLLCSA